MRKTILGASVTRGKSLTVKDDWESQSRGTFGSDRQRVNYLKRENRHRGAKRKAHWAATARLKPQNCPSALNVDGSWRTRHSTNRTKGYLLFHIHGNEKEQKQPTSRQEQEQEHLGSFNLRRALQ